MTSPTPPTDRTGRAVTAEPPTTGDGGTPPPGRRRPTWAEAGGVAIMVATVAALAGFLVGQSTAGPSVAEASPSGAPDDAAATTVSAGNLAVSSMGSTDAPVTIVEWSDFQCPYCGRHATETQPALIERYVDEGLVRLEWRDFPALGPMSLQLAIAGRAAEQQGEFWAFHDAVYASSERVTDVAQIDALARSAGLDMAAFEAAMADPMLELTVRRSLADGQAAGVTGTPAFTVNGRQLRGAQPLEQFVQLIEAELSGESLATPVNAAPDEVAEILANPPEGLQIVDVRTPEEIAEGTVVPRGEGLIELDFYADTFAQDLLDTLDPDKPVLVYCRSGNRSGQTIEFLTQQGYQSVADLAGGIVAWQDAGYSLQ